MLKLYIVVGLCGLVYLYAVAVDEIYEDVHK